MAWIGSQRELTYFLSVIGADKGDDGRFIISGEPPLYGLDPDEVVIPDGTTYFVRGRAAGLAAALGSTSYGVSGIKVFSATNGPNRNPIPKGEREKVRKATKRFDRELVKRLKGDVWSMSIRDAMPKYTVTVHVEDCPGKGDLDRRMGDVLDAFQASGLDKQLYFDGTDYGPLPGPEATPDDIAEMGCPERGYFFYDASEKHPPGVDLGDPGYREAAAWERQCIESSLSQAADRPAKGYAARGVNPHDGRYGAASGKILKLGGVSYELPPGLRVQWSPPNQAWIVSWNETPLRIISDKSELRDYVKGLGAREIDPNRNPLPEKHRAAYRDYLTSASAHLTAAIPLLEKAHYAKAFGAIRHAECDIRQAYTEAVYAKKSDRDLARMVTPLESLYQRLQVQIRLMQEQL